LAGEGDEFEIRWGLGCVRLRVLMRVEALRHVPDFGQKPNGHKAHFQSFYDKRLMKGISGQFRDISATPPCKPSIIRFENMCNVFI